MDLLRHYLGDIIDSVLPPPPHFYIFNEIRGFDHFLLILQEIYFLCVSLAPQNFIKIINSKNI